MATRLRTALLVVLAAAVGMTACARTPAFTSFSSEPQGFTIAYPAGWQIVRREQDTRVWFLPASAPALPGAGAARPQPHFSSPEFLLVFTESTPGPLTDDQARRIGLNLLPIHGVSGFRRFREEQGVVWHRFEVTGTAAGAEWASVGLLVVGAQRFHYVVCAKPLDRWRKGQKQCDEILRGFRPGALS